MELQKFASACYIKSNGFCNLEFRNLRSIVYENVSGSNANNTGLHDNGYIRQVGPWELSWWFSKQLPKVLQEFKKVDDSSWSREEGNPVDRMIYCFTEMQSLHKWKDPKYKELKEEGLELFCKYFDRISW